MSAHAQAIVRFLRLLSMATAVLSATGLIGCETAQSTFDPHGPAARRISDLSWSMTILFLVITIVMWALFAFAFYRRRGKLTEHEPIEAEGGELWITIGGLAVPIIVLTVIFVFGLGLLRDFPIHGMHGAGHHEAMVRDMKPDILIVGHQWWWEIHYLNDDVSKEFVTANELHLPADSPVNIRLETRDVMHSFWVPALHGKVDLIPGMPNFIRIVASQPGQYLGQCAEFCGAEHARMRLLAVVQSPAQYAMWKADQLKPASQPQTEQAKAGEQLFLAGPCSNCHRVRGTQAGGTVAPDLTHIGSRRMIAANTYPNNDGILEAWITHAQSLKPLCEMPNLTQYNGEQLIDLIRYLRQLR